MEVERPRDVLPRAKEAAQRALELDDSLAEAHGVLGIIALKFDWDLEEAQRRFRRTTELNPSYAQGHLWYSLYYEVTGQSGEAIAQATRARDLDPLSLAANVNLAQQYYRAELYHEAAEQVETALELNPNFWAAHWVLGDVDERKGSYEKAAAALSQAALFSDNNPAPLGSLGFVYGQAGQPSQAREVLRDLEKLSAERYVSPFNMAIVHLGLGDRDKAMEQLEAGYRERSRSMIWLNVDRRLRPLYGDLRFQNLRQRLGFQAASSGISFRFFPRYVDSEIHRRASNVPQLEKLTGIRTVTRLKKVCTAVLSDSRRTLLAVCPGAATSSNPWHRIPKQFKARDPGTPALRISLRDTACR